MDNKVLFLILIVFLLIGCGPVTPAIPETTPTPVLKFLPPDFLGDPSDSVTLNVGILAINKDIVFLFGELGEPSGGQQSTLLLSEDGGKHWIEVMNPQKGSSVIDFQMLSTGEGWALVMWVVEGPGTPLLFHTTNNGHTWEQISEIVKPAWYAYPANMVFFDSLNGQIIMSVVGGVNDRLAYMSTKDGGLTWDETGSYSPPFEGRMKSSAIMKLYSESQKDFSRSTSLDYSSRWKVEVTDESIIIYRQLNENFSWSNWETVNTLPKHFDYEDGQIIIP